MIILIIIFTNKYSFIINNLLKFTKLMETMKDMLDEIERQRLSKMADEIPDDEDLERLIEW